jgi:CubicO group peptidase (beta-lactamase class C family)
MTRLSFAFFIHFTLTSCHSTSTSPDNIINGFMKENKVPGMFVAVVKGDSVLYADGFGVADKETTAPVTGKTCMELGSIAKAFTAEVIYDLYHAHLININDPIIKYFPGAPTTWANITIRHLLGHTSGIQNYLLDPRFKAGDYFGGTEDSVSKHFFNTVSTDSMTRMFYSLPVEFSPGASWSYSNTGYYLLGKIAESVTGKNFFELVKAKIMIPFKMQQTEANEAAFQKGCLAKGYFPIDTGLKVSPLLRSNYAFSAGGWATSGEDMIKYLKAIHQKALPSDKAGYEPRNSVNNELPFSYDGGRFYTTFHGMKIISHNGGTPGFSSSWIYVVDKGISIIVLMNRQDYAAIDQLAWDVLALFEPSLKYPNRPLHSDEEKKYTRQVLEVVKALKMNTPYPDGLSKPLKIFMDSENGRGMWKWYFERGFPDKAYCVDSEMVGKWKAYRFRLPFSQNIEYRLTILMNPKNELVQIRW